MILGDECFEKISDNLFRCKQCGQEVERCLINIATHWNDCGGKGFLEALIDKRNEGLPLTIKDVEEIKSKL